MALAANIAVSNQRIHQPAPVDPTGLAMAGSFWMYPTARATGNQYVFHIKRNTGDLYGFIVRLSTSAMDINIAKTGPLDDTYAIAGAITADNVWYHIGWSWTGVVGTAPKLWINGVVQTLTLTGSGVGTNSSLTNQTWDYCNRPDLGRPFKGRIKDTAVWTATAGTDILSAGNISTLNAGGNPATLATAGTLRSCARFIGGLGWDEGTQATCTLENTPTAVDAPHIPLAPDYSDSFPTITGLAARWTCGDNNGLGSRQHVVRDTSAYGNLIALLDVSGNSRPLYRATAASRPRSKTSLPDYRIAFNVHSGTGTTLDCNNAASINNYGISVGMVVARPICTGTGSFCSIAGVSVKTDVDGNLQIEAGGVTSTFSPAVRVTSKPMPILVTLSGPSGAATLRTATLYTNGGTSTATITYSSASGTIDDIGSSGLGVVNGVYQIMKEMALWTAILTPTEAASVIASWCATYRIPTTPRGVVYWFGSSSPAATGTTQSGNAAMTYHLARTGRARVFQDGVLGCGIADCVAYNLTGSGTYQVGETVNQGGVSGKVAYYSVANGVYIYSQAGGSFAAGSAIVGAVSGASYTPANVQNLAVAGVLNSTRYSYYTSVLNAYAGPKVAIVFGSSNPINSGWNVSDTVEIDKYLTTLLKADVPGVKVYLCTNHPRSTSVANNHQAYNAAIKAVTGYWEDVIEFDSLTPFDWLDASLVDDDGVYDRTNVTYYREDNAAIDNIHANETSHSLWATLTDTVAMGAFSEDSGGAGGTTMAAAVYIISQQSKKTSKTH